MEDVFRFKKFAVSQQHSAMRVGTDGVLLGAWARGGNRILDIGTGTGLVALMMAQRYPEAEVVGVEVEPDAAREAAANASASPFAGRVTICATALQRYTPDAAFDAIVSNPPYYADGPAIADSARRQARQTVSLTFADILSFANRWLTPTGELSVVLPLSAAEAFSEEAFLRGFFLARQVRVRTVARKPPKRCLLSFSPSRPATFSSEEVVLQDGGQRSAWYSELVGEFSLHGGGA